MDIYEQDRESMMTVISHYKDITKYALKEEAEAEAKDEIRVIMPPRMLDWILQAAEMGMSNTKNRIAINWTGAKGN